MHAHRQCCCQILNAALVCSLLGWPAILLARKQTNTGNPSSIQPWQDEHLPTILTTQVVQCLLFSLKNAHSAYSRCPFLSVSKWRILIGFLLTANHSSVDESATHSGRAGALLAAGTTPCSLAQLKQIGAALTHLYQGCKAASSG